ncbi:class I SAM-dependent methyltransferase [Paenibacillus sp. GSMTC-2017]|uniref:class I SAM-dependent methyltransferase n=1 Tax=Paenibacillus sp. GSMTC-2017 TaxID=2794350 RepID=UPI0018D98108|nr:class I SAM-dependent methyltransferase [Paenibacillus sp. GSMTC-2017]MBH5318434.1 class I SAM-dependent methyltransferase [Paenibacillus sp. GSMTC-2017]
MNIKTYTESNRNAWNEVNPIHQKHNPINFKEAFRTEKFNTLDDHITQTFLKIGLEGKNVAQLCCNNGREVLSLVNLGARCGTGFDISDHCIEEAKELAEISGLPCTFIRTDVYEIDSAHVSQYDLLYISIGALTWLPDLHKFFSIASTLLKKDGRLVIYEMHPMLNMLALEDEPEYEDPMKIAHSYYKSDPWISNSGIDYVGNTTYESQTNYSFSHTLASIINAVAQSGIHITKFEEHAHDISCIFPHLEKEAKLPMCFTLIGKKA